MNEPEQELLDRLTERSREVLRLAQQEAERFQHQYIGAEHLLLGLIAEGHGVAAYVLQKLGVELQTARDTVESIMGRGDSPVLGEIKLTPRAEKVLRQAGDEALQLNHHFIGTANLLLGLIREKQGVAAAVLDSLSVTPEQVQKETLAMLGGGS
jgi:ATP-dependent Clp protease ATP-binding subunit ClpC